NDVTASDTPFTFTTTTTDAQLLAYLQQIPELNGNIDVNGNPGGPFEVIFQNELAGAPVPLIESDDPSFVVVTQPQTAVAGPVAVVANRQGVGNELQVLSPRAG